METPSNAASNNQIESNSSSKGETSTKTETNGIGLDEKRKSVSFLDEKLIINAIKSTSISNSNDHLDDASNASKASASHKSKESELKRRNTYHGSASKRQYGQQQKNYHLNGKAYQQPKHKSGASPSNKSPASNAVIIYYNNPDVQINVDDLLNKCQTQAQQQATEKDSPNPTQQHKKNIRNESKTEVCSHQQQKQQKFSKNSSNSYPNAKHQHPAQVLQPNGFSKPRAGGSGGPSRAAGSSRFHQKSNNPDQDNNWRETKDKSSKFHEKGGYFRSDHYPYQPQQKSHQKHYSNNRKCNEKPLAQEPITIYYNDKQVSLEDNLKLLKDKIAQVSASNGGPSDAHAIQSKPDQTKQEQQVEERGKLEESNVNWTQPIQAITGTSQPEESEVKSVINPKQEESLQKPEKNLEEKCSKAQVNLASQQISNDPEDVISGGSSIDNPKIILCDDGKQQVICTLVSHPGHFYVKLVCQQAQQILDSMDQFYKNDEHIELTLDVLKPGQYFAALASGSHSNRWIRVKLLHWESADNINCHLIDQGGLGMFKLAQLQPLYNRFRNVPKQAFRVALYGVRPKESSDWLPNEALEFKKLIENRRLDVGRFLCTTNQSNESNESNESNLIRIADPDDSHLECELSFPSDESDESIEEHFKGKSVAHILIERNLATSK